MATNLWPNADIESGIDDWASRGGATISHSTEQKWEQLYSLKVEPTVNVNDGAWSDYKAVIEGSTEYTMSLYIYPTATVQYKILMVGDVSGTLNDANFDGTPDEFGRVEVTATPGASDTTLRIDIKKNNDASTDTFYVDAVMLETGTPASAWENYGTGVEFAATIAAVTDTRVGHGS